MALVACSKGTDDAAAKVADEARNKVEDMMADNPPKDVEDALKRVGEALSDGKQAVPAAQLKTLLPEELAGLRRTGYEAERTGFGVKVSKARAEYGEGDKRMSLMITDLGAVSGLAKMGMELFETEIDTENENGFERTTTYKGHKSFQRLHRSGDQSIAAIMVFVSDRFTVQLDGQNIPFDEMKESIDSVDLESLVAMEDMLPESN